MKRIVFSWGMIIMLLLAACQSLPVEEALPPTQGEAYPAPSETDWSSTQVADVTKSRQAYPGPDARMGGLPEGATIVFRRSGGIAGLDEEWAIYRDGRITSEDGDVWQVPPGKVEALVKQIDEAGFFELDGNYLPLDTCCDRFTYQVSVNMGEEANKVTTIDAAPNVPPELWQVIEEINALLTGLEGDQ